MVCCSSHLWHPNSAIFSQHNCLIKKKRKKDICWSGQIATQHNNRFQRAILGSVNLPEFFCLTWAWLPVTKIWKHLCNYPVFGYFFTLHHIKFQVPVCHSEMWISPYLCTVTKRGGPQDLTMLLNHCRAVSLMSSDPSTNSLTVRNQKRRCTDKTLLIIVVHYRHILNTSLHKNMKWESPFRSTLLSDLYILSCGQPSFDPTTGHKRWSIHLYNLNAVSFETQDTLLTTSNCWGNPLLQYFLKVKGCEVLVISWN